MKVNNLKDLTKLLKLCQTHGVTSIEIDGMKLTVLPKAKAVYQRSTIDANTPIEAHIPVPGYNGLPITEEVQNEPIKMEELTEAQLMFYSSSSTEEVVEQWR